MSISEALLLLATGVLAGVASTVASVASVVSYPVLLAIGLPPLASNVTNTMSLIFTAAGSVAGARPELAGQRARAKRLAVITAAGGAAGACALLVAPASAFAVVQPRLRGLSPRPGAEHSPRRLAGVFASAMYIGYFGAAGGVVLLAILSTMFPDSLIRVNALKNVISGVANAVAAIAFAFFAPVDWAVVPLLAAGFAVGGAIGPRLARRLPVRALRLLVALAGLAMAVNLGFSAYR
jgi:hypothetical protein